MTDSLLWAEKICADLDARAAARRAADAAMVARALAYLYPDSPDGARPPVRPRRKGAR